MTSNQTAPERIRPRDRDAILNSLRAGVVPRAGQQHIQVGRVNELNALLATSTASPTTAPALRFVIGEYGSGKTFFLNLVRSVALQRKLVTVHADLSPDRRLHATGGQARSLYSELMRNMSTRAKPDGGAMGSVVERFVTHRLDRGIARPARHPKRHPHRLSDLTELTGGYDFAEVVSEVLARPRHRRRAAQVDAVRWLRGEYATRTDARAALGVRTIIDDANFYDQLKLLARFVRLAGFDGLLVCLDEMVNLYKLANSQARNSNYEQILRILNDSLQGTSEGLGFIFGGTPTSSPTPAAASTPTRALQSRLAENTFATGGRVDLSGPVIRLAASPPKTCTCCSASSSTSTPPATQTRYLLPTRRSTSFMTHCSSKIGEAYFRTPRNTIRTLPRPARSARAEPRAWSGPRSSTTVRVRKETNPDLEPLPDESEGDAAPAANDTPVRNPEGRAGAGVQVAFADAVGQPATGEDDDDLHSFKL